MKQNYQIPTLPLKIDLETKAVLKSLTAAHRALAELKGLASTIPNEQILINTLTLQEAKDSSAVENIITTHDELFKAELFADYDLSAATKEVRNYAEALREGFQLVRKNKILTLPHILQIQQTLEKNNAGLRKLPGTALLNQQTGETVYTPPQDYDTILKDMQNLVDFMNDDEMSDLDPLIKMAIIHHQFESIHPFYDGNGRTGRIINILYLVVKDLLNLPILYLSRFVIQQKGEYYRLLQQTRVTDNWEEWILFMVRGVEVTALETIELVKGVKKIMLEQKHLFRSSLPRIYSQDLLNNLFRHPYTKIEFVMEELDISRLTAVKYLNKLTGIGILFKYKIGNTNYYVNSQLFNLFQGKNLD